MQCTERVVIRLTERAVEKLRALAQSLEDHLTVKTANEFEERNVKIDVQGVDIVKFKLVVLCDYASREASALRFRVSA